MVKTGTPVTIVSSGGIKVTDSPYGFPATAVAEGVRGGIGITLADEGGAVHP